MISKAKIWAKIKFLNEKGTLVWYWLFCVSLIPRSFNRSHSFNRYNLCRLEATVVDAKYLSQPTDTDARILRTPAQHPWRNDAAMATALQRPAAQKSWLRTEAAFRIKRLGNVGLSISSFSCSTSSTSKHQHEGEIESDLLRISCVSWFPARKTASNS